MALTFKVKGVKQTFKQLNADINEIVDDKTRALTTDAVQELIENTPVDTGKARDSWRVEAINIEEEDLPKERIIVTIDNEVPYIAELNAGSSRQAPPRFIEKTILKYFDPDGVIVQVKNN